MKDLQSLPASDEDTRQERRAFIERMLASPVFEKSARLRDFLRYICDRTLDGHSEKVLEQLTGHRVFNRPINYNPADENIVRVSARQLSNTGDIGAATRLLMSMQGRWPNVAHRNARNMTARDFMRGNFAY